MQQLELITIENPCISVCQSDNRGYCLGCFRSRDERFNWAKMSSPEKRKVLDLCKSRHKRRIAKQKKANQTSEPTIEQRPNPSSAAALNTQNQQNESSNIKEDPTCVAKSNQTIQDMGLDLFDL